MLHNHHHGGHCQQVGSLNARDVYIFRRICKSFCPGWEESLPPGVVGLPKGGSEFRSVYLQGGWADPQ